MKLSLNNGSSTGVTIISNIFIDYYMPYANGEFVKIYLYLLRCLSSDNKDLSLSQVADIFNCTESDVMRTLHYWEAKRLLVLSGAKEVTSIDFLDPMMPDRMMQMAAPKAALAQNQQPAAKKERKLKKATNTANASINSAVNTAVNTSMHTPTNPSMTMTEAAPALDISNNRTVPSNNSLESKDTQASQNALSTDILPAAPSPDRLRELKEMDDVRQMLFIAEQYMGTTLSRSTTDELLYIYDTLHFSVDLIDYLIEYCVSKGSNSIHYIKKVALSWHQNGIDSVSKAKQQTTTFHRNYFTILKALGITNRNPVPSEVNTFNQWLNDYGFTLDIITEACSRTVTQLGKVNYKYTTKILNDWHAKGVRHLTDIQALDTLHRQTQSDRTEQKNNRKSANNSNTKGNNNTNSNKFNNFKQRSYDFNELESDFLNPNT